MKARWRVVVSMYQLFRQNWPIRRRERRDDARNLINAINLEFERRR